MLVSALRNARDIRIDALHRLTRDAVPTVLYGAGSYAAIVERYLQDHGIEIDARFIDSGYPCPAGVGHIEDIMARYDRFNVVLGMADHRKGAQKMRALGSAKIAHVEGFVLSPHYLAGIDQAFLDAHQPQLDALYAKLGDELSRKTLAGFISTIATGDDQYLFDVCQPAQYFQDVAAIGEREVFVDGGAYIGDTLEDYLRRVPAGFAKYYAFEPDGNNFSRLSAMVSKRGLQSVECINAGLWHEAGSMRFAEGDGVSTESRVSDSGGVEIKLDTIDARCGDATFIKMDIEGAELDALRGARDTIARNLPKLALCAYHHPAHLWALADYARSLVPEYKIYFRQHRTICTELVMYASV
jgi:FkbM family methyltransferase